MYYIKFIICVYTTGLLYNLHKLRKMLQYNYYMHVLHHPTLCILIYFVDEKILPIYSNIRLYQTFINGIKNYLYCDRVYA